MTLSVCVSVECPCFTVIMYLYHTHHNGSEICEKPGKLLIICYVGGYMSIVPGSDIGGGGGLKIALIVNFMFIFNQFPTISKTNFCGGYKNLWRWGQNLKIYKIDTFAFFMQFTTLFLN